MDPRVVNVILGGIALVSVMTVGITVFIQGIGVIYGLSPSTSTLPVLPTVIVAGIICILCASGMMYVNKDVDVQSERSEK